MARPLKNGLDYFPFDVDFFEDEKIVALSGMYHIKGEMIAIRLLCAIYRNGYYAEWTEMLQLKILHSLPGVTAGLLDDVVKSLVRWGFFDKNLFHSMNVLTSVGIQKIYFNSIRKRVKNADYPYLLVSSAINPAEKGVSSAETVVSSAETRQSKVKERKKIYLKEKIQEKTESSKPSYSFTGGFGGKDN